MTSAGILEAPSTIMAAAASPKADAPEFKFIYKPALETWARFKGGEIGLTHALHDIHTSHTAILNITREKGADEARQKILTAARAKLLAEFLPPKSGTHLFTQIKDELYADDARTRRESLTVGVSYQAINNIIDMGVICLPEQSREMVYTYARDLIIAQHKCDMTLDVKEENIYSAGAAATLIEAAEKLFPDARDAKPALKTDLRQLLNLSIMRAEALKEDDAVLEQCAAAAAMIADALHMDGYRDEHLRVSDEPITRVVANIDGVEKTRARLSVALLQTFNTRGLGPVMTIDNQVHYMNTLWARFTASSKIDTGRQGALGFIREIDAEGVHPRPLMVLQ